jgi:hypothetical protein
MATVPPADRTSPSLDPRYDPRYQRGYSPEERRAEARPLAPAPAPSADDPETGAPVESESTEAPEAAGSAPLRTGILWIVSVALVAGGVLLHFGFGAAGYGADWSVSTEGGAIRFADGRSVEQVLATQLAVAVAPYLVVLGIATAVATLFVHILHPERGTR